MFGPHFYNQRIRKAVAVFGALFNDIHIIRKNSSGNILSQTKVPLSYGPRRDFLARIDQMNSAGTDERQVAIKLPRMSFEIVAMMYDASRQLPKMNYCRKGSSVEDEGTRLYSPSPYNISFQLSIYAKSQDDALQVVEQILPYFTPHYTLTVNPLDDFDEVKEDTPISLVGVTFSDDYEALIEARRTIIYTLDFEMKINLYKNTSISAPIITQYDVDTLNLDGSEIFSSIQDSADVE
jgi:hypothetical protein